MAATLTTVIIRAGIIVGGFIVAKVTANYFSAPQVPVTEGFGGRDVQEGTETGRRNTTRNPENSVPFAESKTTKDSGIQQHKKCPSSSSHNDESKTAKDPGTNNKTTTPSSTYKPPPFVVETPEDVKELIKKDIVPGVLKKPLSASTYKDYFDALLFAEDYYIKKWDGFEMKNMTLNLRKEAANSKRKERDDKVLVELEMNSIPERGLFLLPRDSVFVQPSGRQADREPFRGLINRMVKSNLVLVEFGEDFHSQHYSACKYDVKFSFNRVSLKGAHQAIVAASDPSFRNFIFPDYIPQNSLVATQLQSVNPQLDQDQVSAVVRILNHQTPPPYLVEGPPSVLNNKTKQLSRTGMVVCEAVVQIYRTKPSCRILICAPANGTCDAITISLKKEIRESDMFRANAALREVDGVPFDIYPTCAYEGECFTFPSLQKLRKFKVILSTFTSSIRLRNVKAGHFTHIFLVDASSATEPETMVALANLANEKTAVTITGTPRNHSGWIRSNIARRNGLMTSYFERLRENKLYKGLDPKVITCFGRLR